MEPPFCIAEIIEVSIESLAFGGAGIGRYQGFVLFVPFTAPGDRIKVRIKKVEKTYAIGELVEVLKSGPSRLSPRCEIFGKCGGCQWQHIDYSEQLRQKKKILESALSKAHVSNAVVRDPIASPCQWHYRNRIQVRYDPKGLPGFYQKESHTVVPFEHCWIAEESLQKDLWNLPEAAGTKIEILRNELNQIIRIKNQGHGEALGFAQVNESQNQNLVSFVLDQALASGATEWWDLYAGKGNFTIPLAELKEIKKVQAVEWSSAAVKFGETLAKEKNLGSKIRWQISKVEESKLEKCNGVLLDPPRIGCHPKALELILESKADSIIYVSCSPATLARDLFALQTHYQLQWVQPFDMFPQTTHIESVSLLKKI